MININELIVDSLELLKIPVDFMYSESNDNIFITFFNYHEYDDDFSDNHSNLEQVFIQVNIWSTDTNSLNIQDDVVKLLCKSGFIKKQIGPTLYYEEYKLYQKPIRFIFKYKQEVA